MAMVTYIPRNANGTSPAASTASTPVQAAQDGVPYKNPTTGLITTFSPTAGYSKPDTTGATGSANGATAVANNINDMQVNGNQIMKNAGQAEALSQQFNGLGQNYQAPAIGVTNAGAAAVNQQQTNQDRAIQIGALGQLQAQANGTVPSAAGTMLAQQSDTNAAQALANAAALGGRSTGGALRTAGQNASTLQQQSNQTAAVTNLQAQQAAQQALVSGANGLQQTDTGLVTTNANLQQQAALANAQAANTAAVQTAGNQIAGTQNMYGDALQANNQANAGVIAQGNINQANSAGNEALVGGIIDSTLGAAGSIGKGAVTSDERVKHDVDDVDDEQLARLAKALSGITFKYDDPNDGEGARVGIRAQDALRGGPVGRMIVMQGEGPLKLDAGNSIGAALAMSAKALDKVAHVPRIGPLGKRRAA